MCKKMHDLIALCVVTILLGSAWAKASGPCANECRIRASVGNRLVKGPDNAAQRALDVMAQINRDNIKQCRDACVSETTSAGCEACAKRVITKEKREQDRNQLAQFDCGTPAPGAPPCVETQQPTFNYTTTAPKPGTIQGGPGKFCTEECKNRIPFEGMMVNGNMDEAKKLAVQLAIQSVTRCMSACVKIPNTDCNQCANENISDQERQALKNGIAAKFPCCPQGQVPSGETFTDEDLTKSDEEITAKFCKDRPLNVGQEIVESILSVGSYCPRLEGLQINVQVKQ